MAKSKKVRGANFIKTSFNQVTVSDLLAVQDDTPRAVIVALSSLTAAEAARLSADEVAALYEVVSFLTDPAEIALALPPDFEPPKIDIAGETFEKLELVKLRMNQFKAPYRLFPALVGVYLGEDALRGPAAVCLATGALLLQQLNAFFERFKDLAGEKPSEDQTEAGIDALHSFGPYAIAEGIAAKYGQRPYEVFQWSAEEIYLELTYQLAKSKYQDNLREIEKRKNAKPKK